MSFSAPLVGSFVRPDHPQRPGGPVAERGSFEGHPTLSHVRGEKTPSTVTSSERPADPAAGTGRYTRAPRVSASCVATQEILAAEILAANKLAMSNYSSYVPFERHHPSTSTEAATAGLTARPDPPESSPLLDGAGEPSRRTSASSSVDFPAARGRERIANPIPYDSQRTVQSGASSYRGASASPYRSVPIHPSPLRGNSRGRESYMTTLIPVEVSEVPLIMRPSRSASPMSLASRATSEAAASSREPLASVPVFRPPLTGDGASRHIPSLSPRRSAAPSTRDRRPQLQHKVKVPQSRVDKPTSGSRYAPIQPPEDKQMSLVSPTSSAHSDSPRAHSISPIPLDKTDIPSAHPAIEASTTTQPPVNVSPVLSSRTASTVGSSGSPPAVMAQGEAPAPPMPARILWNTSGRAVVGTTSRSTSIKSAIASDAPSISPAPTPPPISVGVSVASTNSGFRPAIASQQMPKFCWSCGAKHPDASDRVRFCCVCGCKVLS